MMRLLMVKLAKSRGLCWMYDKRQASIWRQLRALAAEVGGKALLVGELLAEVANLVEAPVAFRGKFDAGYLDLPRDVLGDGHAQASAVFCGGR